MLTPTALTLLALCALLAAERYDSRLGIWIAKPLASTGFILAAIQAGSAASLYGRWVLVALALSWLGDVLLIARDAPRTFQLGILSFLLGHLAYAAAFVTLGPDWQSCIWALLLLLPIAWLTLRWLRPHVPPDFVTPVHAYVAVITAMLVLATGAAASSGQVSILIGAAMFYLSDLAVARDRFVTSSFWNGAWGLPLYYGAQLVLASTPLAVGSG